MRPLFAPRESAASNLQKPAALQHFLQAALMKCTTARKHGGDNLPNRLHQLITKAWEEGSVPQAWKDASIVTIYKKGDRTDCGNYRGISLLSIAGKIFAMILLNRLSIHITPEVVPETQCGFQPEHSGYDILSPTTTRKVH